MKKLLLIFPLMLLAFIAKAEEEFPIAGIIDKAAAASDYDIVDIRYDNPNFTSFTVHYLSVGPACVTPDTLSGVITLPGMPFLFPGLWVLDSHHTISDNASAPSSMGSTSLGMSQVGSLAVFIATDYYGYGHTKDKVHPYLAQKQNARNSLDLLKVALDLLPSVGYKPSMLCNVGYSQGAGVAMAALNLLENDEAYSDIASQFDRGVYTWCGDGPYDIKACVMDYLNHPDEVSFPAVLPMLVNGFLSGAPAELKGDLTFADFITDGMLDAGLETWLSEKKMDTGDINRKMREVVGGRSLTLADIFKPEMTSVDGALAKKYMEFAEADCICTGWQPTYPIKLIHLTCDEVVPVFNTYSAIDGLHLTEDQYLLDDTESTHADYGMTFYLKLITELDNFNYDMSTTIVTTHAECNTKRPAKRLERGRILIERNGKRYNLSGGRIQ